MEISMLETGAHHPPANMTGKSGGGRLAPPMARAPGRIDIVLRTHPAPAHDGLQMALFRASGTHLPDARCAPVTKITILACGRLWLDSP